MLCKRDHIPYRRLALLILVLVAAGCGGESPSSPSPSPSPASSADTLSGFVRETSPTDTVVIPNARVDVFSAATGLLTGTFALTDPRGFYQIPGLSGRVDVRASKEGYEGQSKVAQMATGQRTVDFNLLPSSRRPPRETLVVGQTHTGTISRMDPMCTGMFFTLYCKRYAFTVSDAASFRMYLKWANTFDLDLELWREDTLVAASLTCQSCGLGTAEESITRTIPPGDYEVRVTWYYFFDRDEITPYELAVTPAS